MMPKIVAGRCDTYDVPRLRELFVRSLAELNLSLGRSKVLFKPNLLSGKSPRKAVNTHPLFVEALAEVFLEKGCAVFIGDSPGYESTEKALDRSGLVDVVRKLGLRVASFNRRVRKTNAGISPYKEFLFAEDPLDYDLVVNMPKLKTHTLMGLTAGVKNTFGFIPGLDKGKWHLRCGMEKSLFASVLIDIHSVVSPALTVLDGIVAMEGAGPSHGRARDLGLVAVSDNAFSLDAFLEKTLSFPMPTPVSAILEQKGLSRQAAVVDLGMPEVRDFVLPQTVAIEWDLPPLVKETVRRVFTRKPKCEARRCTMCKTCINVCPAQAIAADEKGVSFDYRKCIRCYCCQEMCPAGAIAV